MSLEQGHPDDLHAPIAVGWTGASGLAYGVRLVEVLLAAGRDVHLVISSAVAHTAPVELGFTPAELVAALAAGQPVAPVPGETPRPVRLAFGAEAVTGGAPRRARGVLRRWDERDFSSPLASGSSLRGGLVICPCSLGTAARIAAGTSETLLLRAADVCLKERRSLIVVPREAPLATHHLENLARLSARGALIVPAAPGFYLRPRSVGELIDFIVQRLCDHLGVAVALVGRWAGPPAASDRRGEPGDDTRGDDVADDTGGLSR